MKGGRVRSFWEFVIAYLVRDTDHFGAQVGAYDVGYLWHGQHRWNGEDFTRRNEEVQRLGGFGRERVRPVSIEVNGIGDDELGVRWETR